MDVQFQRGRRGDARVSSAHSIVFIPLFFRHGTDRRFWQPGFPTIASQPLDRATLSSVVHPSFLDLKGLEAPAALDRCELLVLPYGSAVPADAWSAIEACVQHGGNLLILGGQPLRVPVSQLNGAFVSSRPQESERRPVPKA